MALIIFGIRQALLLFARAMADDSGGEPYKRIEHLEWIAEQQHS